MTNEVFPVPVNHGNQQHPGPGWVHLSELPYSEWVLRAGDIWHDGGKVDANAQSRHCNSEPPGAYSRLLSPNHRSTTTLCTASRCPASRYPTSRRRRRVDA